MYKIDISDKMHLKKKYCSNSKEKKSLSMFKFL